MIGTDDIHRTAPSLPDVAIARQPIYDRNLRVIGYEVLYRNGTAPSAQFTDGNQATSQVLLNSLIEIGLDRIVEQKLAFVNLTREFLLGIYPLPLDERRLVLEILEDVTVDDELVAAVSCLVSQGYQIAIDDATFHDGLVPLLRLAPIMKVELPAIAKDDLPTHVRRLREHPVRLLAEKIETREEFDICMQLGFDYFQGYAISRPERLVAKRANASRATILMLLARVNDPDVSLESMRDVVRTDPVLTVKLLRYINSTRFGLSRRIESLDQAIALLGVRGVRMIVTLVALANATDQPRHVARNAVQRANFCEGLGRLSSHADSCTYFLAGLLSAADLLLEIPMSEIIDSLPLAPALRNGILKHEGKIGAAVRCATAFERLDWNAVGFENRSVPEVREALLRSIEDTDRFWTELGM